MMNEDVKDINIINNPPDIEPVSVDEVFVIDSDTSMMEKLGVIYEDEEE